MLGWLRKALNPVDIIILGVAIASAVIGALLLGTHAGTAVGAILLGFGLGAFPPTISVAYARSRQLVPAVPRGAAIAPESLISTMQIRSMQVGNIGYTVPWAMLITREHGCYLNGDYDISREPGGTSRMRIERNRDGFLVTVPHGERYEPSDDIPWVGALRSTLLPVAHVTEQLREQTCEGVARDGLAGEPERVP